MKRHDYSLGQEFGAPYWTNAALAIFAGACILHSVTVYANGAEGTCIIYDGLSTGGVKVWSGGMPDTYTVHATFPRGMLLVRGLYVYVNASTTEASISFTPAERGTAQDR